MARLMVGHTIEHFLLPEDITIMEVGAVITAEDIMAVMPGEIGEAIMADTIIDKTLTEIQKNKSCRWQLLFFWVDRSIAPGDL
jgi:hypothetical protein